MNALRTKKKKKKNDDDIATLSAVSKATSKKYLDNTGLGHLLSLIISFVKNYAAAKTHNHDGVYAKSSHTHTTSQVTGLDSALAGKAPSTHSHSIGQVTNLQSALDAKQPKGNYAAASHTHGTVTDNFTVNVEDTTTDSGWSMIGGNNGHLLKSIRTQANAPSWLMDNFGAGIAFGGEDTKGVMSVSYFYPNVRFAGGNGTNPNWSFDVAGTTGGKYNLDNMSVNGHSHDASAITSGTLPIARGGTGANNAAGAVRSFFPNTGNLGYVATIGNDWSGGYRANADLANDLYPTIKAKTDAVYQPKGSYAAASHQHSANDIVDVLGVGHGGTGLNLYGSGNSGVPYVFKGQPQFVNAAVGGNTFLMNNAGTLTFEQISSSHISDLKSYLLNNIYKVGYVWISYTNTSPASIIGGSWVAITGRFPYFNAGTGTGGANSQAHNHWTLWGTSGSEAEIYFCNGEHTATRVITNNGYGTYIRNTVSKNPGARRETATYSTTVNNMPAYQTLYAWRRTA